MNSTLFFVLLSLFLLYFIAAILFRSLLPFYYHDNYLDEDLQYPPQRPDWVPQNAFLVDMHCHSTASDGILTPRQLILWHIANGYNGMVISDHNTIAAYSELQKLVKNEFPEFIVIPGAEFTSGRVHLNLIGIEELPKMPSFINFSKKKVIHIIKFTHERGGLVQFNHKDWYWHSFYLPKIWYLQHGIDGFEKYNGFGFIDEDADSFISTHKREKIMFLGAGTDMHNPTENFRAYTEILTNDKSVEGIIHALKEGKTKVYMDLKQEKQRKECKMIPEHGKLQLNRQKLIKIRQWKWLYWLGDSLAEPGKRKKGILRLFVMLSIIICISIII